jgi:hypothetical protein
LLNWRLLTWRLRILSEDWIDGRPHDKEGDRGSGNTPSAKTACVFIQIVLPPASLKRFRNGTANASSPLRLVS